MHTYKFWCVCVCLHAHSCRILAQAVWVWASVGFLCSHRMDQQNRTIFIKNLYQYATKELVAAACISAGDLTESSTTYLYLTSALIFFDFIYIYIYIYICIYIYIQYIGNTEAFMKYRRNIWGINVGRRYIYIYIYIHIISSWDLLTSFDPGAQIIPPH